MVKRNPKNENHALTYTAEEFKIITVCEHWTGENFKIYTNSSTREFYVEFRDTTTDKIVKTKPVLHTENLFFDKNNLPVLIPPSKATRSRAFFISNFKKEWERSADRDTSEGLSHLDRELLHVFQNEHIFASEIGPNEVHCVLPIGVTPERSKLSRVSMSFTKNICKTPDNNIVLLPKKLSEKKKQQLLLEIDLDFKNSRCWRYVPIGYDGKYLAKSFDCKNGDKFFVNLRFKNQQLGCPEPLGLDPLHNERLLFNYYPGYIHRECAKP